MTTFHADGFQPVKRSDEVQNVRDAADIFADRLARRKFGKRGYARIVRPDSWTQNGKWHSFETFIGTDQRGPGGSTETVGRNEWLYVTVRD